VFEAGLRDLGAEVPADLVNLDDDDCEGLGMKKLQKRRLTAALAQMNTDNGGRAVAVAGGGGGEGSADAGRADDAISSGGDGSCETALTTAPPPVAVTDTPLEPPPSYSYVPAVVNNIAQVAGGSASAGHGGICAGMKLEAVDRKHPSLTCVATVKTILDDGTLVITFDGWGDTYNYVAEPSSTDLHPVGYCESVGKVLQVPKGHDGVFDWQGYLQSTSSVAVSPYALSASPSYSARA